MGTDATTPGRGPALALAAIVLSTFVLYTGLVSRVEVPRVHPDELRYALAGSALADGDGVLNRGVRSGFGPAHAAFLASVLVVAGDRESAYPYWKAANALLFALTAIPIFLLARRVLTRWWSIGAAALSLTIPSAIYVSVVMTESLSFFAVTWAILAIVLAIERPSLARQLGVIATIGVATATRAQFGVLFGAFLATLAVQWALDPTRPAVRAALRTIWPTLAALGLGVLAFLSRPLLMGSSVSESLGPYRDLWRGYDVLGVAKWTLYHAADLELYLAVIPFAVAPIVLWRLLSRGRPGAGREHAFALSFVTVNLVFLLVAGAFSSLPYGFDRLHDRYLFYVVPLWIIVFVVWLAEGLPRPLVALATGVVVALVLPAVLPFRQLANEVGVDTVPGSLWVWLENQASGSNPLSGRSLLAVFVVGLLAVAAFLPRRFWPVLPAAVLVVFVATSVLAWNRMIGAPEDAVFAGGLDRAWIDDSVAPGSRVWKLYLETERCPTSTITRHALFLTEFFNDTVERAALIGDSWPDTIPIKRVDLEDGALILESGEAFEPEYVFTQPGIELNGTKVATGTNANLVLWRTNGPVTVTNARTNEDVRTADCA